MKIAVLADIHANYRALEAVCNHLDSWGPDFVFVAGDIVNRGPRSLCCLKFIDNKQKTEGWKVIRGNHEDYVMQRDHPNVPKSGPQFEMFQPVHFSYQQIKKNKAWIKSLPERINLHWSDLGEVRMLHGSMLGNRDGIYPENTKLELERKIAPLPAVFITGHTHRPFVTRFKNTLIVNAGSVGLPFDGDTRPIYAQLTHQNGKWQAKIIRLNYDIKSAIKDFYDFGFLQGGGPLVNLILLELQTGLGQLYQWVMKYHELIQKGESTVEESVEEFLRHPVETPYW
jgi:putative phosphoesterase